MPKIFLVGMPCSGKSSVGKIIAETLNLTFFDLDTEIEKEEGMAVKDIFSGKGEEYFRKREAEVLRKVVLENKDFLLATGGGAPCFYDNMEFINTQGISIYLNISFDELSRRMTKDKTDTRPLLQSFTDKGSDELKNKFNYRIPFYEKSTIQFKNDDLRGGAILEELNKYLHLLKD